MPAGSEQLEFSLVSVAIVTFLAFLVPVLLGRLQRVKIPMAVGEILVGVIVGKSGLNLVKMDSVLDLLGFLGLAAIMFVSGLEIDFGLFRPGGPAPPRNSETYHPGLIGLFILVVSFGGAWWFAGTLEASGQVRSSFLAALVITTVGLSLIVPVLKERNLMNQPLGRVLMVTGVLGDFVPILGLAIMIPFLTPGGQPMTVLFVAALGLIAAITYRLAKATRPIWALRQFLHGTAQLGVRGAFALMLLFLVLAEAIGVEAVLGTFLAGMLVSLLAGNVREQMVDKLDVLGFGFLTPFFFITVGIQFDLPALLADPAALRLVPVLTLVTVLVKFIPGLSLMFWYPRREAVAGAVLLGTQMSVTIAAASLIARAGVVTEPVAQAFILVAMITAIACPIIFTRLMPAVDDEDVQRPIIIAGLSRATGLIVQRLQNRGMPVKVITAKDSAAGELMDIGAEDVIIADPRGVDGLTEAGASEAEMVVAIGDDGEANMEIARLAKNVLGVNRALAFVDRAANGGRTSEDGIEIINPDLAAVDMLESLLVNPGAASLMGSNGDTLAKDVVLRRRRYAGIPLREMDLPPSLLILSVMRRGEKLIPHGDTELATGDRVTLVGPADDVKIYQHRFEQAD